MKVLISGFRRYEFECNIQGRLEELGYNDIEYLLIPDREKARTLLGEDKAVNLMILAGAPASEFEDENGGPNRETMEYLDLAREYPQIPSILLVPSTDLAVLSRVRKKHPPNYSCTFFDFERIQKDTIEGIVQGHNYD